MFSLSRDPAIEALESRHLLSADPYLLGIFPEGSGTNPIANGLATVGSIVYFSARDNTHGQELWKSDGTFGGTTQVKDIKEGSEGSDPTQLTNVGGTLFFIADDGVHGRELWKSDGTEEGTVLVKDVYPGTDPLPPGFGDEPKLLGTDGTLLYFSAPDANDERALWKSDGTTAGTTIIATMPQLDTYDPAIVFNGKFHFTSGRNIYRTDGTAAGTVPITTFTTGNLYASDLVEFDGKIVFSAGGGIWSTDGNVGAEQFIKALPQDGDSYTDNARYKTVVGDTVYFSLFASGGINQLWKTDGTTAGTEMLKVFPDILSQPLYLVGLNDKLFFSAADENGRELWTSDGTSAGTVLVKDIQAGSDDAFPSLFTVFNNQLYFSADDGTDYELWTSDGTEAGTQVFLGVEEDIRHPRDFVVVGDTLYFVSSPLSSGGDFWKTDGTLEGTRIVREIRSNPNADSEAKNFTQAGDTVYFTADHDLWSTDGGLTGAEKVGNFFSALNSPGWLTEYQGELFFVGDDGTSGLEPWRTDGTEAGTTLIKDIDPLGDSILYSGGLDFYGFTFPGYSVGPYAYFAGELYFAADDGTNGSELWKTDGTESGTVLVKDINPGSLGLYQGSYPGGRAGLSGALFQHFYGVTGFVESGGSLFFEAYTEEFGFELWKTDGTESGTVMVKDIISGNDALSGYEPFNYDGYGLQNLTDVNGTLFFITHTGDYDYELWKSDGTEAGTVRVKDINPGIDASFPDQLTVFNDTLYFSADDGLNGRRLWKSDGTESGTVMVTDLALDSNYYNGVSIQVSEGMLYFSANDGIHGSELWKSDGTSSGTVMVSDILPGVGGSNLEHLIPISGGVAFSAFDIEHGRELWISDGTAEGTQLVSDLWLGNGSSSPTELAFFDGKLYFTANDGNVGRQPWVVDLGPQAVADAGGPYVGNQGSIIVLSASGSENGTLFEWDLDNDGLYDDATGETVNFNASDGGVFTIRLRVNGIATDTTTVTVNSLVDAGGPYFGDEGSTIVLSATSLEIATLFEWDLDNDGLYDDATGETVNFVAPDDGVYPIGVRVDGIATDTTTVTVNNVAPSASIAGTTAIYRGETVTFTLYASDPSSIDAADLFSFEINLDGNGTIDMTVDDAPSGTSFQHTFPLLGSNNIQVRATDKDGATGDFSQLPITVTPHVLRDDGQGNTDLIWGGTPLLDAVYVFGEAPAQFLFVQFEGLILVNRLEYFGDAVTGKIILHGYGFSDVLVGEFALGNVLEIHGGEGDDVIVGGYLGDELYGDAGSDVILGGTRETDGNDLIFGGEGKDTLFGHYGADTLDGGAGEDLLISDRFGFSNVAQDVQRIAQEWKSARTYAERTSNIQNPSSTGANGDSVLIANVTVADDGAEDLLIGGLGELDWFFYDFDQDLLGDTIEIGELTTDSDP